MRPIVPSSRSTFTFHDCIRPGRKLGSVKVGATEAAAPAPPIALPMLMLLVAVPDACAESGVTSGGLPVSPTKYPVLDWFTMIAYAPRTAVLPSPVGFQMTPRR